MSQAMPALKDCPPIDRHFARLMVRLEKTDVPGLEYAAALASYVVAQGHVCLPRAVFAGDSELDALAECSVVGRPGDFTPLILDGAGRLYLQRYWAYENALIQAVRRRLPEEGTRKKESLEKQIAMAFAGVADETQLLAVSRAVNLPLSLISGGPGTGKTYVAALAMIALAEDAVAEKKTIRFALSAPTGKAAARLKEVLEKGLDKIGCQEAARAMLTVEAKTLHRLIGMTPDSLHCKYNLANPLPVDVVIVDESSMVDLPMMTRLFAALRDDVRVILIGDQNQLSSVEAGHVFGDLAMVFQNGSNPAFTQLLRNYRSEEHGAIARLAQEVNEARTDTALELLRTEPAGVAARVFSKTASMTQHLKELVMRHWGGVASAATVEEAMELFSGFRILCATRAGMWGVESLNRQTEEAMETMMLSKSGGFYKGQPILILQNDYQIGLFNGDIGMVWPDANGVLQVYFTGETGLRAVSPARLPQHETAYAMTIHKSQGSEFGSVLMIVPPGDLPVLTRELVYTGVTRARKHLELWYDESAFRVAVGRRIQRWSGLQDGLKGDALFLL